MSAPSGRVWLLDLDNTLHDAATHVFPLIDAAMTAFVARHLQVPPDEASAIRQRYWERYGATLLGMVRHHGVDPHHFLAECHPLAGLHALVRRDARLAAALRRLPGRRVLLTNAPLAYTRVVLRALGIAPLLHAVVTIEDMVHWRGFHPKPSRPMMRRLTARLRVRARHCVLVEDSAVNLHGAHRVGMRTVLVTGTTRSRHRAMHRHRAGAGRRIQVRIQSASELPRIGIR